MGKDYYLVKSSIFFCRIVSMRVSNDFSTKLLYSFFELLLFFLCYFNMQRKF